MNKRQKLNQLMTKHPKLAQALVVKEITLRNQLRQARQMQELETWHVAEKLGWSVTKVQEVEGVTKDLKMSDLRAYLLATGLVINFEVATDKALG